MSRNARFLLAPLALLACASARGQTVHHTLFADDVGDQFGAAVAFVGDLDEDGLLEFAVGAPGDDDNGVDSGSVRVYRGVDASELYRWDGPVAGAELGFSVANVGDLDDDGFPEIGVGAPEASSGRGRVFVFSGATGLEMHDVSGNAEGGRLGHSVSDAGDVNADGTPDFVAGAIDSRYARVYSGVDATILHTFLRSSSIEFGAAVDGAGDVNGDGYGDVIVGAPHEDLIEEYGSAWVYSGIDGAQLYSYFAPYPSDEFGWSVAGVGDVDADGYDDFLVGSRGLGGLHSWGPTHVDLYSGFTGTMIHTWLGGIDSGYGISPTPAGDMNADGVTDIVTSKPYAGNFSRLHVLSGGDGGLYLDEHMVAGDALALRAADWDGDLCADFLMGGPFLDRVRLLSYDCAPPGTGLCYGDGSAAPCPCGNDSAVAGAGCVHSGGVGMRISGAGSRSVTGDDLRLTASDCPPDNAGIFYVGEDNLWPGSVLFDGLQCAGGNARRFQGIFQTDGVAVDTGFVAQDPSGTYFVPSVTYVFQYFSRDFDAGASPCGTLANLSPGWRVTMLP